MSKPIGDSIRVEPIWNSHLQCRQFQIIVVNKDKVPTFTTHKDVMARDYLKLKLSDSEVFQLIQELQKSINSADFDPKVLEARMDRNYLQLVKKGEQNE